MHVFSATVQVAAEALLSSKRTMAEGKKERENHRRKEHSEQIILILTISGRAEEK